MSPSELTPEAIAAFERRADRGRPANPDAVVSAAASAASDGPDPDRPPRRDASFWSRRAPALAAAAALVALLVGTTLVLSRSKGTVDTVTTPADPAPSGVTGAGDGWRELGRLPGANDASGFPLTPVVFGDHLVLPGILADGAEATGEVGSTPVLDRLIGRWQTFAPPSTSIGTSGYRGRAVRAGDEVIVFGVGRRPSDAPDGSDGPPLALAFDVARGSWRAAGSPPGPVTSAVWTGTEVLAWSAGVGLVAWDPVRDSWPVRQPGTGSARLVWTGHEVVVVGGLGTQLEVTAFDPATLDGRVLPAPPHPASLVTAVGPAVAVVDSSSGRLSTLNVGSATWTERATAPISNRAIEDVGVGVGDRLVIAGGVQFDASPASAPPTWSSESLVWDPVGDTWSSLPALPDGVEDVAAVTADGNRLLAIALADDGAIVVLELRVRR